MISTDFKKDFKTFLSSLRFWYYLKVDLDLWVSKKKTGYSNIIKQVILTWSESSNIDSITWKIKIVSLDSSITWILPSDYLLESSE